MQRYRILLVACIICAPMCFGRGRSLRAAPTKLPAHYFSIMASAVRPLLAEKQHESSPGAMLAAAVLYAKQHPANPSYGDKRLLDLTVNVGDQVALASERDPSRDRQDYEWEIHFWLDAYRLLKAELGPQRRRRWEKEIRRDVHWFAEQVAARIDFPRYQSPYIRTSTNHLALFASTVYLAGRVLPEPAWERLGARALHRLAAEEQTADGYWGEFTDHGPATNYNYLTMTCVALYWEHSHDMAAFEALRRATDFHKQFTWPDGTPVETINGRNRYGLVSPWGQFGFSHWPDGRGYAAFLAGFFHAGSVGDRDLGRLAQNALYYHDGPTARIPQESLDSAFRMRVPAGIRISGPWTVCLSGLIDVPIRSQFTLDRQGNLSIYHKQCGLIVTGANSKHQPGLATFREKRDGQVTTVPLSSRLRMRDDIDRLALSYRTFFAELHVPKPSDDRLAFSFQVTERGPHGILEDAELNLQLCLRPGEVLETGTGRYRLDGQRIALGSDELGGWIRHHGWTLHVPPAARLVWPVHPFNPYRNAPEPDLQHAVGRLSVPVAVQPPETGPLDWGRQTIPFVLSTNPIDVASP